jgi:NADPH:quinone reductase-like Zn-dependent oxidoreductase
MLKLLQQHRWQPLIGARFSLEHAAEAHQLIEDRESIGKVILTP